MFQLFQLLLIIFQVEQVQITLSGASCMDVAIITKGWPSVAPQMTAYCIPAKSPGLLSGLPDLDHFFQLSSGCSGWFWKISRKLQLCPVSIRVQRFVRPHWQKESNPIQLEVDRAKHC